MTQEQLKIPGEIIGAVALVESLFIFAVSTRGRILKLKFVSDFLWFCNYLCLGGWTGALLNLVAMGRETVFALRDKYRFASHIFWLPFFMLLTLLSPMLECLGAGRFLPITLLPACGSLLTVMSLYQRNPAVTRYIAFGVQGMWLVYSAFLGNITGVIANSLSLLSAIIGTVRAHVQKKRTADSDGSLVQ